MAPPVHAGLDYRPSYLAAAVAGLAVLALYLVTLAPASAMWDTSEYITAAYTLGIPHPPGNPFFVLIGRVFAILPIGSNVATRINLLAAVSSAVSAAMWFLITERVLVSWFRDRWQRIVGGALAALIGATSFTVWSQSVVNEKVYTVSLVGLAVVAWLVVRWCDDPEAPKADRLLVLASYLMGLGYANHMAGMLTGPAMAVAVLVRKPAIVVRWRLLLACAGALVLGGTPFLTQPIRAAHFPAINEGEPTGCTERLEVGCTFSQLTYDRFDYNFSRGQYGKPELSQRQAPFAAQVGMWWLYFKWQYWRDWEGKAPGLQGALAAVFFVLGLLGAWVHWRRDRRSFAFFGPLMFTLTLLLIYYLNFKYGASQAPELGDSVDREVRDRDYFYLWSFSAWSVWAALGLAFVWESVAALVGGGARAAGGDAGAAPTRRGWLLSAPVLLFAVVPLVGNWSAASKRGETDTDDFSIDLLNSVEPNGILVTVGDNDTFPLWYAQEVLKVRRDVTIANTSLMNTDWYVRQMVRRRPEPYDAATGPAAYRGRAWPAPAGGVLKMTIAEADALPEFQEVPQAMMFQEGNIRAIVNPEAGYLQRADLLVYRLIRDNPDRPIHFSRTAASYPMELGLGAYVVTTGLTRKLLRDSVRAGGEIVPLDGEGFVDVARTRALWSEYRAPAALIRKDKWIDRPSVGIPYLYMSTGLILAETLAATGDRARADSVLRIARGVARATRLEDLFRGYELPAAPRNDSPAAQKVPVGGGPGRE
jgi:hypothetical protein